MRIVAAAPLALLTSASALVISVQSVPATSQPGGVCYASESTKTDFGKAFSANVPLTSASPRAGNVVPTVSIAVAAVRLEVKAVSPAGRKWTLALRDPAQRILAILTESDFGLLTQGGTSTQWTGRLETNQVSAELVDASPGVSITIVSGMALPTRSDGTPVFSIQGTAPRWADPFDPPQGVVYQKSAEAVGMLVTGMKIADAQGVARPETWCCSGAMLTSDIFITNWHCGGADRLAESDYWNSQVRANGIVDLGWQSGRAPRRQYSVTAVLRQDERLDYALLRVRPTIGPGAATGRALPVKVELNIPAPGSDVFMVHHAQCQMKLVSFGCKLESPSYRAWTDLLSVTSGPDITHRCDTEPGASGAPVFNVSGKMVALHHLGFQTATAGGQCQSDRLNKAVSLASIFADVQQANPGLYAELRR